MGNDQNRWSAGGSVLQFQSTFPRGERLTGIGNAMESTDFNPRSHVGNDDISSLFIPLILIFQSTFPRGERQFSHLFTGSNFLFQSTFPRGERLKLEKEFIISHLFQSTFPRGERLAHSRKIVGIYPFQSTFPRGERLHLLSWHFRNSYFNPRSHVGNDQSRDVQARYGKYFNPRSHVGNDELAKF